MRPVNQVGAYPVTTHGWSPNCLSQEALQSAPRVCRWSFTEFTILIYPQPEPVVNSIVDMDVILYPERIQRRCEAFNLIRWNALIHLGKGPVDRVIDASGARQNSAGSTISEP